MSPRRDLLKAAAVLTGGAALSAKTSRSAVLAFVGTYETKASRSGILVYEVAPQTGALSRRDFFPHHFNPFWLALSASGEFLYTANETGTFEGRKTGAVSAFAIERDSCRVSWLNDVDSQGTGPAHLSIHPSGRYVFVANYDGGNFAVLPVLPDGRLGAATDCRGGDGAAGPERAAASAPPGSYAISGHDAPHPHMIQSDPSGRYVLGADLGLDRILIWKFDEQTGKLTPNDPASVSLPPGDGPRHFVFHANRRWLYSIQEEASTIVLFDFDAASGRLSQRQTVSSLPHGFTGTSFASEILVSSDSRFVYAANRLHDSITAFSIGDDGTLSFAEETWTRGDYPNLVNFDPGGAFLYSCNQRSDAITSFRVNRRTGRLTFTGQYTPVPAPSSIVFLS
ncbi:MAG TPA: lactonase family protein [Bryobacteraceae bacterium]|nr:lactonase family protein [Bryobacteraceae bacterium]